MTALGSEAPPRPVRVLVAGTGFGRIYLRAVEQAPEFRLVGILAKGSATSRQLAADAGVPFYSDVSNVPDDIDVACVVLRSGITGGPGAEVAQTLLERGIPVLHEHPVHPREITRCLQAAKRGGVAYAVHTLYPHIHAVRQFLAGVAHVRETIQPRFIDAACHVQVLYPLLDIIGRALGGLRPWSFELMPGETATELPFRILRGRIRNVPLTLRVHNQVHPEDPDNHGLLLQQVSWGCEAGVLHLVETHGPVIWTSRLHSPRDPSGRLRLDGAGTERLADPSAKLLSQPESPTFHQVFADTWPRAVAGALRELVADIPDPRRRARSGKWALDVSLVWRDVTEMLGVPEIIRPGEPERVCVRSLAAAVEAEAY